MIGEVRRMTSDATIRYAGTFRFHDRATLERSLQRARNGIHEEQELAALKGGWLRCFVMFDAKLTVNIALPALPSNRDAAVAVFEILSREAIDGAVTATINNVPVERYAVTSTRTRSGPR